MLLWISAVALVIKAGILVFSPRTEIKPKSNLFVLLVVVFATLNTIEFFLLLEPSRISIDALIRTYYALTVLTLALLSYYSTNIARQVPDKSILIIALFSVVTISALVIFSELIVNGVRDLGHAVTAARGEYYFIYSAFAMITLTYVAISLQQGRSKGGTEIVKMQSTYVLIALMPIVTSGIAIAVLMNLGYAINAAGVMPIATTAFLLIALTSEDIHKLTGIRLMAAAQAHFKGETDHQTMTLAMERIKREHELHMKG